MANGPLGVKKKTHEFLSQLETTTAEVVDNEKNPPNQVKLENPVNLLQEAHCTCHVGRAFGGT